MELNGEYIVDLYDKLIKSMLTLPQKIIDFLNVTIDLNATITLFKIGDFDVKIGLGWFFDLLGVESFSFQVYEIIGASFILVMTLAILKKVIPVI